MTGGIPVWVLTHLPSLPLFCTHIFWSQRRWFPTANYRILGSTWGGYLSYQSEVLHWLLEWTPSLGLCSESPVSWCCSVQVKLDLRNLLSSSAMNPPRAKGTSDFCRGRAATHQLPNACTELLQCKSFYPVASLWGRCLQNQLPIILFWLNQQYAKTSLSQECWKN